MAKSGKVSRLGCLLAACAILATCTGGAAGALPALPGDNMAIISSSNELSEANVLSAGMTHAISKGYYTDDAVYKTNDPIPTRDFCYAVLSVSRTTLDAESLQARLDYLHKLYVRCGLLPDSEFISTQDAIKFIDRMWKLDSDMTFDLAIQTDDSTDVDHLDAFHDLIGHGLLANDETLIISENITYGALADVMARQDGAIERVDIQPSSPEEAAQKRSEAVHKAVAEKYTAEEVLDFFETVALKSEYNQSGSSGSYHNLVRWTDDPITYSLNGVVDDETKVVIEEVMAELSSIPGVPDIVPAERSSDIVIHVGTDTANSLLTRYNASGFCSLSYDNTNGHIVKANVYSGTYKTVDTVETEESTVTTTHRFYSADRMKHIMLEEITQTLGLINDSDTVAESIFYDHSSDATSLADIDKLIIEMLYCDAVKPNMNQQSCRAALTTWLAENVYNAQ